MKKGNKQKLRPEVSLHGGGRGSATKKTTQKRLGPIRCKRPRMEETLADEYEGGWSRAEAEPKKRIMNRRMRLRWGKEERKRRGEGGPDLNIGTGL